ncbi:hypothetical protein CLV24_10455 [Pontibacter ummariensis]|uniref:Uncharacterized protein n=1 Tax=Pontibacter ummariensis TaxID=1610492 RepID=A0A239D603_9BACT|nr:hypothetical protein [Pontibacter ummariensis]PRY14245.1 hypothetical protein CLV24_10455 [Pontibacter ummariensis]SNS27274.1 hypothetical protein SAMN06296052_10454 [Pontibacter ummariensis]
MQNRRIFRIILVVACFFLAGLNAYEIYTGEYNLLDVFLLVMFLIWGVLYMYLLRKGD